MAADFEQERWLLITVSTAGAAGSLRVAVWRKLRSLGALYIHQSVCLLPARPEVLREVRRLVDRVRSQGGNARSLTIRFDAPGEEEDVRQELRAARDDEYGEVIARAPDLLAELRAERHRGRATYEEVEESEADLERFRSWQAKIDRRDYFHAGRRADAHAAIDQCARELEAFEAEAFSREADSAQPQPRLKAVDGP